jgi:hypothetical protein
MRITFGIHKDKKIADLTVDQLHGFADWLDRSESRTPKMRVLQTAILREIARRDEDQVDDEDHEARVVGWKNRTAVTTAAMRILSPGVEPIADVVRFATKLLGRLQDRGVTLDQALSVARWARAEWDSGRSRFVPLLDIGYLWSVAKFPAFLAAARTKLTSAPVEDVEIEPDAYLEAAP